MHIDESLFLIDVPPSETSENKALVESLKRVFEKLRVVLITQAKEIDDLKSKVVLAPKSEGQSFGLEASFARSDFLTSVVEDDDGDANGTKSPTDEELPSPSTQDDTDRPPLPNRADSFAAIANKPLVEIALSQTNTTTSTSSTTERRGSSSGSGGERGVSAAAYGEGEAEQEAAKDQSASCAANLRRIRELRQQFIQLSLKVNEKAHWMDVAAVLRDTSTVSSDLHGLKSKLGSLNSDVRRLASAVNTLSKQSDPRQPASSHTSSRSSPRLRLSGKFVPPLPEANDDLFSSSHDFSNHTHPHHRKKQHTPKQQQQQQQQQRQQQQQQQQQRGLELPELSVTPRTTT